MKPPRLRTTALITFLAALAVSLAGCGGGGEAPVPPGPPVVETCVDGTQNSTESDVDCGGAGCLPCTTGRICAAAGDCDSGVCAGGTCAAPTCTDGVHNGTESDVDCGGSSCAACAAPRGCAGAIDCASGVCTNKMCAAPSCGDGVRNGDESDVDCGGSCGDCAIWKRCTASTDCANGVCTGNVCLAATCMDQTKNGDESDVDCGGSCGDCGGGKACGAPADCGSSVCTGGVCQAASCTDQTQNGDETDIDCGGSCGPCVDGDACASASDCASDVCTGQVCQAPTCMDGVKNASETDVDCGGTGCMQCPAPKACQATTDCASGVCTGNVCQPATCGDGVKNGAELDVDCGNNCGGCDDAGPCMKASDCASGVCTSNVCQPATCGDDARNQDETGVDCGGPSCGKCGAGQACGNDADCDAGLCVAGMCSPDPSTLAPPLPSGVPATVATSTSFLYEGPNAIQTGVTAGAIEPRLAAVVRGRVLGRDGTPLPDVTVTLSGHPELGQTSTRADGAYDLVVNGGGAVAIDFQKGSYLPIQRQAIPRWGEYVVLDDVVMIGLDAKVTRIDLPALTTTAVAQGSRVVDADGTRQATIMFPAGTQASMIVGGISTPLTTLNVRATEFTVGARGPQAMPATLPAQSGYTYCAELSVDEAVLAGASEVRFSQPVGVYIDNFLNFPVGGTVPSGYYDRARNVWVPMTNGRIVKVLSISAGAASLDVTGGGAPATGPELAALGITAAELQAVASTHPVGATLWRVTMDHFTAVDTNWPRRPDPLPAPQPDKPADPGGTGNGDCDRPGSIIGCEDQTLGEQIAIAGTPYKLTYNSGRVAGRQDAFSVDVQLTGATVPTTAIRMEVEVQVAGRSFTRSLPVMPNQRFQFTWDGLDAYGRRVPGRQTLSGRTGYVYKAVYQDPSGFAKAFAQFATAALTGNRAREEFTIWQEWQRSVGAPAGPELGGWYLDAQHSYASGETTLYLGAGGKRVVQAQSSVITTIAGTGVAGSAGDGGPATAAQLNVPHIARYSRDGSIFIADYDNNRIRRIRPDGTIVTFAGAPNPGYQSAGDGGLATAALVNRPHTIAFGPDGSFYFSEPYSHKIRRVTPDGIIRTVAGTGTQGFSGDGGPATSANLNTPSGLDVGPDGAVYIADNWNHRLRRVAPDGTIETIAGTGATAFNGDDIPAKQATLHYPAGVFVETSGTLLIGDGSHNRIRRIGIDGIIRTIAGTGVQGYAGDGGPATSAQIDLTLRVTAAKDGTVYFTHYTASNVIRKITPDGIVTTIAGNGVQGASGDGGPSLRASLNGPHSPEVAPDGTIIFADLRNHRIRRVGSPTPGTSVGDTVVPSDDGGEIYVFDALGRHLRTVDAETGAVRQRFGYDASGRLSTITDLAGNITTIERDAAGLPTAIVAPGGQRTSLAVDAGGTLTTVTDPAGRLHRMTYAPGALLATYLEPDDALHRFTYDASGRLTRDEGPGGKVQSLARTELAGGWSVSLISGLGRSTLYDFSRSATGDLTRNVTNEAGGKARIVVGASGTTTRQSVDGMTETYTMAADPRFGMQAPFVSALSRRTPSALTATTTSTRAVTLSNPADPLSVVAVTETATTNGRTTTRVLDVAARTVAVTSPVGRVGTTRFDALGRVVEDRGDPALTPTTTTYDAQGRVTQVARGSEAVTYAYNAAGDRVSETRGSDQTTATYDVSGRLLTTTSPGGHTVMFGYDGSGRRTSVLAPSGATHAFTYAAGRPASYAPPGGGVMTFEHDADGYPTATQLPTGRRLTYDYDAAGQLTLVTLPEASIGFAYGDRSGRPTELLRTPLLGTPQRLSIGYDGSLPVRQTYAGAANGQYTLRYDSNLFLVGVKLDALAETAITRDADGLVTGQGPFTFTRGGPRGAVSAFGHTAGSLTGTVTYDGAGRELDRTHVVSGSPRYRLQLTHNARGRISTRTETVDGVAHTYGYSYDGDGQLVAVTRDGQAFETYAYDVNGNRTSRQVGAGAAETASYDARDRLVSQGAVPYTFDADGYLTGRGSDTFSYAADGTLVSATVGAATVGYTYDGFGRRVARTDGSGTTQYLYADGTLTLTHSISSAGVVTEYFYDGAGRLHAVRRSGTISYVTCDQVGTPRAVFDAAGAVLMSVEYDAFGVVVAGDPSTFELPIGFAGGLRDPATGLVRFGARDYDPGAGRWTARDPLLFAGGQLNLYTYAGSNPVMFRDPSGMIAPAVIVGIGAAVVGGAYVLAKGLEAVKQGIDARQKKEAEGEGQQATPATTTSSIGTDFIQGASRGAEQVGNFVVGSAQASERSAARTERTKDLVETGITNIMNGSIRRSMEADEAGGIPRGPNPPAPAPCPR